MANKKIRKLLIANRGEIALRVQRACNALKIKCVSVASEPDKGALHARNADELVLLGGASAKDSYLCIDKIIKAAVESGCDALHPGYGFLSENPEFVERVEQAGLIFVGPRSETVRKMGNKTAARAAVESRGVPCAPGSTGGLKDEEILKESKRIGFPLIVKASAGGGGRGMRVCNSFEELREALPRARAEVLKNFGSDDLFLEKFIVNPRHVEVQVFGDAQGNILHFGTRDCSAQRRHQKLVEEAPAPNLSIKLRSQIQNAAVLAAESVGYLNAGTCEFLVSGEDFFFLEMNTRIQVEHPVT